MSSFILKIIAVISMFIDHIAYVAPSGNSIYFNMVGRIAFPIFAYQSVQAYVHTKNLKKHLIKLAIFEVISQLPFSLFFSAFTTDFTLNIFFTFLLALFALYLYDKCKNKLLGFIIIILFSIVGELIKVDYGAFGILLIFVFYYFEKEFKDKTLHIGNIGISSNKLLMSIIVIIMSFAKYLSNIFKYNNHINYYMWFALFTSASLIFILLYNKQEGPKVKYFFYIFYPLHLTILYLINTFLI